MSTHTTVRTDEADETAPATAIDAADVSVMGVAHDRVDGLEKVTGQAAYAFEHDTQGDGVLYGWIVGATTARGRVTSLDTVAALAHDGVHSVVDHTNAPRLADTSDGELTILQDDTIGYRGQVVAVVLADSLESAREGARLVTVHQDAEANRASIEDGELYAPETVNAGKTTDTAVGDLDAGLAQAEVVVDRWYSTPHMFNSPMEPHALTATWDGERLVVADSTQAVHSVASTLATALGLESSAVRVVAPYVGGGFGSKGLPHSPEVAAALVAMTVPGRTVKLAVTRQQMFALTGYRTQTRSRLQLGADADGRLVAIGHDAVSQTSAVKEFAEQTADSTRVVYAAPHRRTTHRVAALDVAVPSWMRAPGEMPGMFAQEVAMDELAVACGVDPVELRRRNEPEVHPESGLPYHHRRLVECLERGAERFGWSSRPSGTRATQDGDWWVGTGVAAATYPANFFPGNSCRIVSRGEGRYAVSIGAVDIGTGARTVLAQIAADALGVGYEAIDLAIADTDLPFATVAGGSSGTSSWGTAIVAAAQQLRRDHGLSPDAGVETTATAGAYPDMEGHALHSFGAVYAETRVHRYTGEIRVPRLLGVYSVGRVINPTLARSQLLGGLVMGMSVGLFEDGYRDARTGHVVTQDLATYHVASAADVKNVEAEWLGDADTLSSPMGSRGIGEIGIVGTAAALANATYHATGTRVRSLPLTADHFLE